MRVPYIRQHERLKYVPVLLEVAKIFAPMSNENKPGELAFLLTAIVREAVGENARFSELNLAIGALESVKLEFYRKTIAPYEDRKIVENGDL